MKENGTIHCEEQNHCERMDLFHHNLPGPSNFCNTSRGVLLMASAKASSGAVASYMSSMMLDSPLNIFD
jgi:hypothetical protein